MTAGEASAFSWCLYVQRGCASPKVFPPWGLSSLWEWRGSAQGRGVVENVPLILGNLTTGLGPGFLRILQALKIWVIEYGMWVSELYNKWMDFSLDLYTVYQVV